MLVQEDDVGRQPLQPPELLRLERLLHERDVVLLHHPHEKDREIARDAVSPQTALPERALGEKLRRCAQRAVLEEDPRSEPFVELRFLRSDIEVTQRDLRVRVSERERACRRRRVVVFLREGQRGVARLRHPGGEGHPRESPGCEPDPLAQADARIEDGAGRPGQRAPVERRRVVRPPPAAEEARPVGFPFHLALHASLDGQHVERPRSRLVRRALPARAQERRALCPVLRLDEELSERGVREVVGERTENDLGIARHLDLPRPVALVRDREPAHLDVVLRETP